MSVDAEGNLLIADAADGRIVVFDGNGVYVGVIADEEAKPLCFKSPAELTVDEENRLYTNGRAVAFFGGENYN